MKILFVGMHNKLNMSPLDSKTFSGKIIDKVSNQLNIYSVKTNLCEVEYLPDIITVKQMAKDWYFKYLPSENDIIILLGQWVQKNFRRDLCNCLILDIAHPASLFGTIAKENYILNVVNKITSLQNVTKK